MTAGLSVAVTHHSTRRAPWQHLSVGGAWVDSYEQCRDPRIARTVGTAMQERFGSGDVVTNLAATGLVANAWALTGDRAYAEWVCRYVDGWIERAHRAGGPVPDNVGPSGVVGEHHGGRWYGGAYGWYWPHGFYSVGAAVLVGATSAQLVSGDDRYLDFARRQIDLVLERAEPVRLNRLADSTLGREFLQLFGPDEGDATTLAVSQRCGDDGWFDRFQVPAPFLVGLWAWSLSPTDRPRVDRLLDATGWDIERSRPWRTKEDNGHALQWYAYLHGRNPSYPETALTDATTVLDELLAAIDGDTSDLTQVHVHHFQNHSPISVEALQQLIHGAPPPLYNGGLLGTQVRWFDPQRDRPGLPADVAALVTGITRARLDLELVNLADRPRTVELRPGTLGASIAGISLDNLPRTQVDAASVRITLRPASHAVIAVDHDDTGRPPRPPGGRDL